MRQYSVVILFLRVNLEWIYFNTAAVIFKHSCRLFILLGDRKKATFQFQFHTRMGLVFMGACALAVVPFLFAYLWRVLWTSEFSLRNPFCDDRYFPPCVGGKKLFACKSRGFYVLPSISCGQLSVQAAAFAVRIPEDWKFPRSPQQLITPSLTQFIHSGL